MSKKVGEHYVNNKLFTEKVGEWAKEYRRCKALGLETPEMDNYITECFYKIAERYARKPRWSGYTYVEDMISEAVLNCIKYAHNFDSSKYNNAFAYFTSCCINSFKQFTNKERKLADFKFQMVKENCISLGRNDFNDINLWDDEYNEELILEYEDI